MTPTLEQIIDLAAELREAGFDIGTQQYVAAQDLLLSLEAMDQAPTDSRRWRTLLAPIFCSTPEEQTTFYARFERWIERHPALAEAAQEPTSRDLPSSAQAVAMPAKPRRQWLKHPAFIATVAALALAAGSAWYLLHPISYELTGQVLGEDETPLPGAKAHFLGQTIEAGPDGNFSVSYVSRNYDRLFHSGQKADLHIAREGYISAGRPGLSVHQPSPQKIQLTKPNLEKAPSGGTGGEVPLPSPTPTPTPAAQQKANPEDWRWILPGLVPWLLLAGWFARRWWRRRAMLRRLAVAGNPRVNRIRLKGAEKLLFQGRKFRRAAQELRRHRDASVRDLDVDGTVSGTIRQGGLFSPWYRARRMSPEYLYLIDRAGVGDEQARFGEEMAKRLTASGVFVDRYYFQGDPLTCRLRDPLSPPLTLNELASRHPEHRLIVFGDGAGFLSPITGEPEPWLEMLDAWPRRALLTPESTIGYRERALAARELRVLPATEDGVAGVAEAEPKSFQPRPGAPFPRLILDRPRRWLERHEPRPETAAQLIDQLRAYLDSGGWLWLRACAVYPVLSWEITLYLGVHLLGNSEEFESRLLSLVRLPWLRHGSMPDWLRTRLLDSLTPAQELAVRRSIETMLSELHGQGLLRIEVAESKSIEKPSLRRRFNAILARLRQRRQQQDFLHQQPDDSPLRDAVFLGFLAGRRTNRLSVRLPELLRRILFQQGQPALGLHPWIVAFGAMAASAMLLWAFHPAKRGLENPPPPTPAVSPSVTPTPSPTITPSPSVRPGPPKAVSPSPDPRAGNGQGPVQAEDPPTGEVLSTDKVDLGNGVALDLVSLSAGEFTMGSKQYSDETPHRVRVLPFAIGKTEVTQAQWKAVMGEKNNPSRFKGDDLPVEQVSWNDVQEFIKQLNEKTGMQFRLPTEAEWEYAARAGSTTVYSFGNDEKQLGGYAWFGDNSGSKTHPVGGKTANRFGLFDMYGNVYEWCSDWYDGSYYAQLQKQGIATDPRGPRAGSYRVVRGGGWDGLAVDCRSAFRHFWTPGFRHDYLGFRLVRAGR